MGDTKLKQDRECTGISLKTDKYTKEKSMLKYARLMVEMPLDGEFPDYIEFANEKM